MIASHFIANHYTTKTTVEAKVPESGSQVSLSVLSHNPSELKFHCDDATPDHALVVLQQGSKSNAQQIASFTPAQARELADALYATAAEHEVY